MATQPRTSGKRCSNNRGWWWDHFVEHPGYATKEPASMVSGKAKVICTKIYNERIAREQQIDQDQINAGQRDSPRDLSAITGTRDSPTNNHLSSWRRVCDNPSNDTSGPGRHWHSDATSKSRWTVTASEYHPGGHRKRIATVSG
ncbi:hypothetical protein J3R83DRAFT_2836 [Lanmaoa asiatica]|nr:hypothetical protein J3R83DRAFT_2836 [Lanmaoa asiatica]